MGNSCFFDIVLAESAGPTCLLDAGKTARFANKVRLGPVVRDLHPAEMRCQ
jgi:hypothetical protein